MPPVTCAEVAQAHRAIDERTAITVLLQPDR